MTCPPSEERRLRDIEAAADALVDAQPRCNQLGCDRIVTHTSLDAANDPIWHCEEHAHSGGWDDSGPFEHKSAPQLRALCTALGRKW